MKQRAPTTSTTRFQNRDNEEDASQEANQTPLFLSKYKFPTASTVHEVLHLCHKSNPAKGITRPLKSMTQEENRQHPKTRKKVSW